MSDTATEGTDSEVDERRQAIVDTLTGELGAALVGSHVLPGTDLWIRVARDAWVETFTLLRDKHTLRWFDFLSAIDWMPSPYGRSMDAEVDNVMAGAVPKEPDAISWGYAGGETRFQVFARVYSITQHWGITVKADLPDDDLSVATLIPVFAGANWHEREAWEMFGITFVGHPDQRHLYLPGDFEGNPLRKDFPLLARMVKPWPGIVDVEPMPGDDDEGDGGDS